MKELQRAREEGRESEEKRVRKKEIPAIHRFTPQMAAIVGTKPDKNQKPEIASCSPVWPQEPKLLGYLLLCRFY